MPVTSHLKRLSSPLIGHGSCPQGFPCWWHSSLASDGVCRAVALSSRAGGLLHHRFTLTCLHRRFIFCGTFHRLRTLIRVVSHETGLLAVQPLAGITPCDARTFLTSRRDHAPFQAGSSVTHPAIWRFVHPAAWRFVHPAAWRFVHQTFSSR
jgi:hypothetical protein